MAQKIVKLGNPQKTVFTLLIATLLLEFGSLTKMGKLWKLAFSATDTKPADSSSNSNKAHDVPAVVSATIPRHPGGLVAI